MVLPLSIPPIIALAYLLLGTTLLLQLPTAVRSFPNGAGGCAEGVPAVGADHLPGGVSTIFKNGSLVEGNITVFLDGEALTPGVTTSFVLGQDHVLSLSRSIGFKGVLFRMGGDTGLGVLQPLSGDVQIATLACTPLNVSGVTHTSNDVKTLANATLRYDTLAASNLLPLDVTVVISNDGTSEYYYSPFTIRAVVAAAPTVAPITAAAPTASPVAPSLSPTTTPIAPTISVPIAPTTTTAVPIAPTATTSVPIAPTTSVPTAPTTSVPIAPTTTSAPVNATNTTAPITPTTAPVNSTAAPITPTTAPVNHTTAPVSPTTTATPIAPATPTTTSTAAPVKPSTAAPAKPTITAAPVIRSPTPKPTKRRRRIPPRPTRKPTRRPHRRRRRPR